jgi:hypothetical protein
MAQPRPMSTPIFDELLREFASRMEGQQREREEPPTVPPPATPPQSNQQPSPPNALSTQEPVTHRHRAD